MHISIIHRIFSDFLPSYSSQSIPSEVISAGFPLSANKYAVHRPGARRSCFARSFSILSLPLFITAAALCLQSNPVIMPGTAGDPAIN